VRVLAELDSNTLGTVSGAAPGMPEVFAALETGSPVGDGAPSLDWRVEGVGGASTSTDAAWDGDPVARGWLLTGTPILPFIFNKNKF